MKRKDLICYLENCGCKFLREGSNHTVYMNPIEKKVSAVPRHREINDYLCRKICNDSGIKKP
ncbi:MAG TPA: type II toxin-antitoxin system HicA family toxin [Nitrospirae bacterium]|nr:type II toxin-antitoxin system HicA family toxin [Nitrospirota bacterium]